MAGNLDDPEPKKLHECDFPGCSKSFPKLWRLKEHQCSAHTGERPHICTHPGCNKAFIRSYHLKRHMISHLKGDKKPTFICSHPGCERSYTLKQNLRKHEKSHSTPLPYKCTTGECEAAFKKRSQLALHRNKQHGEETKKLLKCNHQGCLKAFSWPKDLKRHLKSHEGYKCTVDGCDVVCSSWSEMRKHSPTHSKVCSECGKTFTRTRQLRLHSAVHATSRCVLTCKWNGCGRTYTTLYNLQQHISSYHCQERPHRCTHEGCSAAFSTKQACVRHQRTEHSNQPKPKRKRKKKRSLSSHLSGYNPSKSKAISTMTTAVSASSEILHNPVIPGGTTGTSNKEEASNSSNKNTTNKKSNSLVKIDSDTARCRGMSAMQLKSLKFLVPVIPRIAIN